MTELSIANISNYEDSKQNYEDSKQSYEDSKQSYEDSKQLLWRLETKALKVPKCEIFDLFVHPPPSPAYANF